MTITTRLVDTATIPMLLRRVGAGRIDRARLITYRFPLGRIVEAYAVSGAMPALVTP